MHYVGKTALITGASSGIGESFAYELASRKMNLVLVARSEDKLQALASQLRDRYSVSVEVITADLSREGEGLRIYDEAQARQLHVDMLINNAGFSTHGAFESILPAKDHQQVMLNVVSVVDLTHAFIPDMLAKGEGSIVNVGSTTSFYPLPRQAVYAATKAFVLSFSEALWIEYRKRGIKVLALCPGATNTDFFSAMGRDVIAGKHSPQQVVRVGLSALEHHQHYVIPGFKNSFESNILPRLLPRAVMATLVGSISQRAFK
ncbi:SDR family oxidoreductase [Phormidium tenue FACHB-886]|nr:SDR family oxidoreductase [Phormidium tenue FACHB-886]